jgi:plastocyanin
MAVVTGAVVLAAALGFGGSASAAPPTKSPKPKAAIEVGDNFFKPAEVEVAAGTVVTWTNKGKILHNVVPVKGSAWGTKALTKGKSYSYRFKKPGRYAYYCSFHGSPNSGQRGVIVVTKPEPPTTTTVPAPSG